MIHYHNLFCVFRSTQADVSTLLSSTETQNCYDRVAGADWFSFYTGTNVYCQMFMFSVTTYYSNCYFLRIEWHSVLLFLMKLLISCMCLLSTFLLSLPWACCPPCYSHYLELIQTLCRNQSSFPSQLLAASVMDEAQLWFHMHGLYSCH